MFAFNGQRSLPIHAVNGQKSETNNIENAVHRVKSLKIGDKRRMIACNGQRSFQANGQKSQKAVENPQESVPNNNQNATQRVKSLKTGNKRPMLAFDGQRSLTTNRLNDGESKMC